MRRGMRLRTHGPTIGTRAGVAPAAGPIDGVLRRRRVSRRPERWSHRSSDSSRRAQHRLPRKATVVVRALPASCRRRRFPAGRTRAAFPLSESDTDSSRPSIGGRPRIACPSGFGQILTARTSASVAPSGSERRAVQAGLAHSVAAGRDDGSPTARPVCPTCSTLQPSPVPDSASLPPADRAHESMSTTAL